ncbi:MAG: acyl carrier protein [Xanthomonadales bacterium]|nr:acyl carrier protein [Xanthomonadales bacterium]
MDKQQIYLEIKKVLVEQFEIDESRINPNVLLYEELEIDSIDAVDLLVRVKELTGKRIPPEDFQDVRTIQDVLNKLADL